MSRLLNGCFLALAFLLCSLVNGPARATVPAYEPPPDTARVYLNPNTGRFWTMDSYEGSNQDPLSLHKYLYCHGSPVNGVDPSGHEGNFISMLSAMVTGEGLQAFKAGAEAKIKWEMRKFYRELANDLSPWDLSANLRLGYEGEAVWVNFLRTKGFRANRSPGPVAANGPDVFATRIHRGRLQLIVGEVKATSSGFAGIGKLRWNVLNNFRQMSYSWIDKYLSDVLEGIVDLGISGIGQPELKTLLDRGEVDMYLLAGLKKRTGWDIKGFRLLNVDLGDLEIAGQGDPEITNGATGLPSLPGF